MNTDVYERISSQIANELKGGPRPRLKPWNVAYGKERITRLLHRSGRADVKGANHAAA